MLYSFIMVYYTKIILLTLFYKTNTLNAIEYLVP
jgi:hypothetical protein